MIPIISMNKIPILIVVFLIGIYLRFWHLGAPPLWVDEALFVRFNNWSNHGLIPVVIHSLFNTQSEYWLRFPSACAGSLTILAVYWVISDKRYAILASSLVAVFPLFVVWSRLARPYSFVGLFVVLGWRFVPCYLLGLLSSCTALIGLDLYKIKQKKYLVFYLLLGVVAITLYLLRQDVDRTSGFLTLDFIMHAKRLWYVPLLVSVLYLFEYWLPALERAYTRLQSR